MFTQKDKAEVQKWGAIAIIVLAVILVIPSDLSRKVSGTFAKTTMQTWSEIK